MVSLLFMFAACSARHTGSSAHPEERVKQAAADLTAGKTDFYRLTTKGDSGPGSFYVLDPEGRLLWHPIPVLIGSDFSEYGFVKYIIERKTGCIFYNDPYGYIYVFFVEIEKGNILCLTVKKTDYPGMEFQCERAGAGF